jgi:hypothetical protein
MNKFSFYRKPITNLNPYKDITLVELYKVVKGNYYKAITEALRKATPEQYKKLKASTLDYITPGGCFAIRNTKAIWSASGLISIDIDHIDNPEEVKNKLASFSGMQLIFTSPSAKGVKAILTDPQTQDSYSDEFEVIKKKIKRTYGLTIDNTSDIARACFLCHDPNVWISKEVSVALMVKKNPVIAELVQRFELTEIN